MHEFKPIESNITVSDEEGNPLYLSFADGMGLDHIRSTNADEPPVETMILTLFRRDEGVGFALPLTPGQMRKLAETLVACAATTESGGRAGEVVTVSLAGL